MDIVEHTFSRISSRFSRQSKIVLALSGGPDSVFLGEILHRNNFQNVTVAHFDHALRGAESDQDHEFCRQKAQEWRWKFVSAKWQKPQKSEKKARLARYEFLEKVRKDTKSEAIFLAQHQNDQAETIFFQFLRGTGIKGLNGMQEWDEERRVLRPLLGMKKADILLFLEQNTVAFRTDSSNLDPEAFDRNFLRLKVFPLLQERFPHFSQTLSRNAEVLRIAQNFLDAHVAKIFENLITPHEKNGEFSFVRSTFCDLHQYVQGEILRKIFATKKAKNALHYEQIQELITFLCVGKSGKKKEIAGITLSVYADNVFIA